ncbi:hypothetical protein [Cellulomonas hominis]
MTTAANLVRAAQMPVCYRCGARAAVAFLDCGLGLTTACTEHGRGLWRALGGAAGEASGTWVWWTL